MTLPPSYLRTWADRFRHPRVCLALTQEETEVQPETGYPPLITAMLDDLAADLDDAGALDWLLENEEFGAAEELIAGSPAVRDDPEADRDAQQRLTRQLAEARQELIAEAELDVGRAEAAGLPVPAVYTALQDEDSPIPLMRHRFAEAADRLDEAIEAAVAKRRDGSESRGLPNDLKKAWAARLDRGQLVVADRLLAMKAAETTPPDVVRRPPVWDPTVDAMSRIQSVIEFRHPGWSPTPAGRELLSAYVALREMENADSVLAFSSALAALVGSAPGRPPAECPGGYLYRLDLTAAAEMLPLSWLADVRVLICTRSEPIQRRLTDSERLIVIDCGGAPSPAPGRSNLAVLTVADLIRLACAEQHHAAQLLRLVGRYWTGRPAGIASGRALPELLAAERAVAWARLAWLVDVLDLGGVELVRILTNEVDLHPGGLQVLLEILLGVPRERVQRSARARVTARATASRLEEIILPPQEPDPGARVAFLAAVAADGFAAVLEPSDLQLSIAVEGGGDAPERLLEDGARALAGHPLVESTAAGIRLRRCAVLLKMREEAPRLLLASLAAASGKEADADDTAWSGHRWALAAGNRAGSAPDALRGARTRAIDATRPVRETYDLVPLIDVLVADLRAAYPRIAATTDLPAQAAAAMAPEVFQTILAELLQNAVDTLDEAGRHRLAITVEGDPEYVIIDVADDGVAPANPAAFFRKDGKLYDAERLAKQADAYLELSSSDTGGDLQGAHFRLIVYRERA